MMHRIQINRSNLTKDWRTWLYGIEIDPGLLIKDTLTLPGNTCSILVSPGLSELLEKNFGRPRLCLKVYRNLPLKDSTDIAKRFWQHRTNWSIIIQNLYAAKNLAPHVYDWVVLNGTHVALVMDYITPARKRRGHDSKEQARKLFKPLMRLMQQYHLCDVKRRMRFDIKVENFMQGKYVDFNGFLMADPEQYKADLIERICGAERCMQYQSIEGLPIAGWRNTRHRLEKLRFNEIDFRGKTVLDLGCNHGAFMRAAYDRGAKRVIGIDRKFAELAGEINNWLGYWNFDFLGLHLARDIGKIRELTGLQTFDIVIALSIIGHARGYKPWVAELTGETLLLEGHQKHSREDFETDLKGDFSQVEFLGDSTDQGPRPLFKCWK